MHIPRGFVSSTLIRLQPGGTSLLPSSLALDDEFRSELKKAFNLWDWGGKPHIPWPPPRFFSTPGTYSLPGFNVSGASTTLTSIIEHLILESCAKH